MLEGLNANVPHAERAQAKDDPQSLARMATRAEIREPGTMERTFGGRGGRAGMGGMMAGSFLSSIAGVVVGSAIAQSFFGGSGFGGAATEVADQQDIGEAGDAHQDSGQDAGDEMAADMDGDAGGDFGDFGGGDF